MDPWTALGTAASILQLIDYSTKFLNTAKQIYKQETAEVVESLQAAASVILKSVKALEDRPRSEATTGVYVTREEEVLNSLIADSAEVSNEIIACLNRLTVDKDAKIKARIWRSVFAAVRTVWNESKIEELSERLEKCQRSVANQMLVLVNAKVDVQSTQQKERFDELNRGNDGIVEVMSINYDILKAALAGQTAELSRYYKETTAMILTWKDGKTRTITRPESSIYKVGGASSNILGQNAAIFRNTIAPDSGQADSTATEGVITGYVPDKILSRLYFRHITERFDGIALAHERTFSWIFEDASTDGRPWDSFMEWLETGKGCYWIRGKAGSGKSTLMKYLHGHRKTLEALMKWAGPNQEAVAASYFFWNLGSDLQKTQSGLFRSLLFDILDEHRHLIPGLFPEVCRAVVANPESALQEVSFFELKKAFWRLSHQKKSTMKLCLFIDGIDEYEGDHNEVCELLTTISESPNLKTVLSSREIPACVVAFAKYPHLRLQDLTYGDMKLYVDENLGNHPYMKTLEVLEGNSARLLVSEIASKASGVFLWLMLVTKSLLNGLQNSDRIVDLRRRLEELPDDLSNLYEHMLGKMSPRYQEEASKIIQVVLLSTEVQRDYPLTLLQLSFAEEDLLNAVDLPVDPLTDAIKFARCEAMDGRIRSRCCGLVEAQVNRRRSYSATGFANSHVGFLHKTVVEFLRTDAIWNNIVHLTADSAFDPTLSLLGSCLYEAKTSSATDTIILDSNRAIISMHNCLLYCAHSEVFGGKSQTSVLAELDKCISSHWSVAAHVKTSDESPKTIQPFWPKTYILTKTSTAAFKGSFLALTCFYGLSRYVTEQIDRNLGTTTQTKTMYLAENALLLFNASPIDGQEPFKAHVSRCFAEAAITLLRNGADPNVPINPEDGDVSNGSWGCMFRGKQIKSCSVWEFVLAQASRFGEPGNADDRPIPEMFAPILEQFVAAGADLNFAVPSEADVPDCGRRSPLRIIQELDPDYYDVLGGMKSLNAYGPAAYDRGASLPKATYERFARLMEEKGAVSRRWEGEKLMLGPREPPGFLLGRPVLNQKGAEQNLSPNSSTQPHDSRARSRSRGKMSKFWKNIAA